MKNKILSLFGRYALVPLSDSEILGSQVFSLLLDTEKALGESMAWATLQEQDTFRGCHDFTKKMMPNTTPLPRLVASAHADLGDQPTQFFFVDTSSPEWMHQSANLLEHPLPETYALLVYRHRNLHEQFL